MQRGASVLACEEAMTEKGFLAGILSSCLYPSTECGVSVLRHGDFVVLSKTK